MSNGIIYQAFLGFSEEHGNCKKKQTYNFYLHLQNTKK